MQKQRWSLIELLQLKLRNRVKDYNVVCNSVTLAHTAGIAVLFQRGQGMEQRRQCMYSKH